MIISHWSVLQFYFLNAETLERLYADVFKVHRQMQRKVHSKSELFSKNKGF